jgi:hypothetical protein
MVLVTCSLYKFTKEIHATSITIYVCQLLHRQAFLIYAVTITFNQVVTWSKHEEKVNILYLFGEYVLSADAKGNIFIWAFKGAEPNSEPVGSISLGDQFTPTCIMHPDTYLNKVLN